MNPAFAVWYCRYLDANLAIAVFVNRCFGLQGWTEERSPAPWVIGSQVAELYNPRVKKG